MARTILISAIVYTGWLGGDGHAREAVVRPEEHGSSIRPHYPVGVVSPGDSDGAGFGVGRLIAADAMARLMRSAQNSRRRCGCHAHTLLLFIDNDFSQSDIIKRSFHSEPRRMYFGRAPKAALVRPNELTLDHPCIDSNTTGSWVGQMMSARFLMSFMARIIASRS
jgi:hypothetical protein